MAGGALAGPALFEFAQQLGPVAIERAKNDGRDEPNWDGRTYAQLAQLAYLAYLTQLVSQAAKAQVSLIKHCVRASQKAPSQPVEQTGTTIDTGERLNSQRKASSR